MSKETLKNLTEIVLEVTPDPDELTALLEGREDRKNNGTVPHNAINWD